MSLKILLRRTRLRLLLLRIAVGRPPALRKIQQALKNQAG
jgi:hypothetical protein